MEPQCATSVGTGGTNTVLAGRAFWRKKGQRAGVLWVCEREMWRVRIGQSREGDEKVAGDQGLKCHVEASEAIGSHGGL